MTIIPVYQCCKYTKDENIVTLLQKPHIVIYNTNMIDRNDFMMTVTVSPCHKHHDDKTKMRGSFAYKILSPCYKHHTAQKRRGHGTSAGNFPLYQTSNENGDC